MWKYVSSRIRDSLQRTCNQFESHRPWSCGNEKVPTSGTGNATAAPPVTSSSANGTDEDIQNADHQTLSVQLFPNRPSTVYAYLSGQNRWQGSWSSSSSGQDDFKQNCGNGCNYHQNFLGALTWSSAIVCGWYTSQIVCMKRRRRYRHHLLDKPGHGRCGDLSKTAVEYAQQNYKNGGHSGGFDKWGFASTFEPTPGSCYAELWFKRAFGEYADTTSPSLCQINNDDAKSQHQPIADVQANVKQCDELQPKTEPKTVDDAVQDLLKVIGDIEFQIGLQHMETEQFAVAVRHFKLGTSHQHVGATFNLGVCYELGLGVERDLKMALACYRVAAAMGHAKALYNVGIFHAHGLGGLSKNRKMAREFFMVAAKLGQYDAQKALGMLSQQPKQSLDAVDETTSAVAAASSNPYMPQSSFFKAVALA